jgi:solute carrier family 12 (potassium/chloride transporter), member 4/6
MMARGWLMAVAMKPTLTPAPGAKLGTFLGVYTPSLLTILGVVLFLRTGWVVGQVGLVPALAIIVLAHAITGATALSVSAVATNMRVGAGGAYYMISRSLGLEIGGAIGVPLFLAQTFSVTLYAFGFAESLQLFWPQVPLRPVAAATILAVALVSSRSAGLALKLQLPVMALLAAALVSLFAGTAQRAATALPLWQGIAGGEGFWPVFAVFFPAVTGLMAGVSLSGDLADPKRSIPVGTVLAVATGFVVYLIVPVALAMAADSQTLVADNLIWFKLAAVPALIFPGLVGAILSSAVGSILGAPRTLEALIEDRVLPRLPRRLISPRLATNLPHLLATAVALAAVALGNLNAVAPVLTMFFLTTYGMVNLVAGLEQLSGAPSYRPAVRVPWLVSLAGGAGCLWVMWLINRWAAVAAVVVEVGIYFGLRRRLLSASWGDLRYGALMSLTRSTLLKLRHLPVDPRNWRPHILVFAGDAKKRLDLVRYAAWLNQNRGILTVSHLLIGELAELAPRIPEVVRETDELLDDHGLVAFAEAEVATSFEEGVLAVCQANGIAGISSNTIMMGWSEKPERLEAILRVVRGAAQLGKSTLLCRIAPRRWAPRLERIDVWWGGLQNNGDMLLLFAHLMSVNPEWSAARIEVKAISSSAISLEQTERTLAALLARSRINAERKVIRHAEGETVQQTIQRESRDADLVFMGLREAELGEEAAYGERLRSLVGDLPTVILVRAAGPFAGRLLLATADAAE